MNNPAIVVIGYNRLEPLQRLLSSLYRATYTGEVILHISLDHSENIEIRNLVEEFEWPYGPKTVIIQPTHLGLKDHVLQCGDLVEKYGEIIMLEDDLMVAPHFYKYACKAAEFYEADEHISGISLYSYHAEENNFLPFRPLEDGSGLHFIQVPSSWGQLWNKQQWKSYREWLKENPTYDPKILPKYARVWGENSWKRHFMAYMAATDRYFVFPNGSYSTNFEERGTHASFTGVFQVPLNLSSELPKFIDFSESKIKYDAYFELQPECVNQWVTGLEELDYSVDLFGGRPLAECKEYIITTRKGDMAYRSFSGEMKPLIQNLISQVDGDQIGLYRTERLTENNPSLAGQLLYPAVWANDILSNSRQFIRVSIVIPVVEFDEDALLDTLGGLSGSIGKHEVILSTRKELKSELQQWVWNKRIKASVFAVGKTLDELILNGLKKVKTEAMGWLYPGSVVSGNELNSVGEIFGMFRTVSWIAGTDPVNLPGMRWTPGIALSMLDKSATVCTQGMFWKHGVLNLKDVNRLDYLFFHLLKSVPLNLIDHLLVTHEINIHRQPDISKKHVAHLFKNTHRPRGIFYRTFRSVFRWLFLNNSATFRSIYVDKEQLPFVLRYDNRNGVYYSSNF